MWWGGFTVILILEFISYEFCLFFAGERIKKTAKVDTIQCNIDERLKGIFVTIFSLVWVFHTRHILFLLGWLFRIMGVWNVTFRWKWSGNYLFGQWEDMKTYGCGIARRKRDVQKKREWYREGGRVKNQLSEMEYGLQLMRNFPSADIFCIFVHTTHCLDQNYFVWSLFSLCLFQFFISLVDSARTLHIPSNCGWQGNGRTLEIPRSPYKNWWTK